MLIEQGCRAKEGCYILYPCGYPLSEPHLINAPGCSLLHNYARLFLTRGHRHEQCHVVDSLDVLERISTLKSVCSVLKSEQLVSCGKMANE